MTRTATPAITETEKRARAQARKSRTGRPPIVDHVPAAPVLPPEFARHPPLRPLPLALVKLLPIGATVTDRYGNLWTVETIDTTRGARSPMLRRAADGSVASGRNLHGTYRPIMLPDPAQLELDIAVAR